MSDTPRTDAAYFRSGATMYDLAGEMKKLERENTELREMHLMQLAAISTATLQNTVSTRADRITPDNPYYTVAYGDVCRAVDREMELRAERDALHRVLADAEELERYQRTDGRRHWASRTSTWLRPDGAIVIISAKALDAAKEAKP